MSQDLFRQLILEEARRPAHTGRLDDYDAKQAETNASCGDKVTVYVKSAVDDSGERYIQALKWEGSGCSISMAAMSLLAKKLQGMTFTQLRDLSREDLEEWMGLEDGINPGRRKCIMLGMKTIQTMISDL